MSARISLRTLALSTALAALTVGAASTAWAQSSYYVGTANVRDPVIVDLSVLDNLGQKSNLADLLRPGPVVISSGSPATQRLVPEPPLPNAAPAAAAVTAGEPLQLTQPSAAAPAALPQSGLEPAGEVKQAQREAQKISGEAAATPSIEPVQTGNVDVPTAPEVAAVAPPPLEPTPEPIAVAVPVPEPVAVPEPEPVVEAAPEPEPVAVPEPEPVVVPEPEPAPEPEVVAALPEPETELSSAIVAPPEPVASIEPEPVPEPSVPETTVTLDLPEPETQVASIDPNAVIETDEKIEIRFGDTSSELPGGVDIALDRLAERLEANEDLRIQLMGFANNEGETTSQARRLSLFRALAVRTYLIKKGIRSTRMDVRALGNKLDGGAPNRVDVVVPQG